MDIDTTVQPSDNTFYVNARGTGDMYLRSSSVRVIVACREGHTYSVSTETLVQYMNVNVDGHYTLPTYQSSQQTGCPVITW